MHSIFLNISNMKDFRNNWNEYAQARLYLRALTINRVQYK